MSSKGENCCFQNQKETITEAIKEEKINFSLNANLKPPDEENEPKCHQSSDLKDAAADCILPVCSIKIEPEDLDEVEAENVSVKEEIKIEEDKAEGEMIGWTSNAGPFNPVQKNELKSEGEERFNCTHCPYKTNRRHNFMNHYLRKHKQCTEVYKCSFETRYKSHLTQHSNSKHSKGGEVNCLYKCVECSYETITKRNLRRHFISKHSKEAELYKCQECSYETRNKFHLINHFRSKHAKEGEVYKCPECSYETRIKGNLTQHYKGKHSKDSEVHKCTECSFESIHKSSLALHVKYQHTNGKVYKCPECSHETRYKGNFNQHYKWKHSNQAEVYRCQECAFETKRKDKLTSHFRSKHSNQAKLDESPGRSLETRRFEGGLMRLDRSKEAEMYKCVQCSFETRIAGVLTQHYKLAHTKR